MLEHPLHIMEDIIRARNKTNTGILTLGQVENDLLLSSGIDRIRSAGTCNQLQGRRNRTILFQSRRELIEIPVVDTDKLDLMWLRSIIHERQIDKPCRDRLRLVKRKIHRLDGN